MKRDIRLSYLLLVYEEEKFIRWCRSLSIFRFCKAHPYPDDLAPDRFIGVTTFRNKKDLKTLLNLIKPKFTERDLHSFLNQAEKSFLSGKALINETKCYLSINEVLGTLTIEVSGTENDQFAVDNSTFKRTKKIDEFLEKMNINFVSSPNEDDYCISPEFYPEVWDREMPIR